MKRRLFLLTRKAYSGFRRTEKKPPKDSVRQQVALTPFINARLAIVGDPKDHASSEYKKNQVSPGK